MILWIYVCGKKKWVSQVLVQVRRVLGRNYVLHQHFLGEITTNWIAEEKKVGRRAENWVEEWRRGKRAQVWRVSLENPCVNYTQQNLCCLLLGMLTPSRNQHHRIHLTQIEHALTEPYKMWHSTKKQHEWLEAAESPQLRGHITCQWDQPRTGRHGSSTLSAFSPSGLQGADGEKPLRVYLAR